MNKKAFRAGINFINVVLPLLVIYSVLICFLFSKLHTDIVVLYTILFLCCPLVFYAAYELIDNMFIYLSIHIACLGATIYFAPNKLCKILFGITLAIIIIFSIYKKNDIILPKPTSVGRVPILIMIVTFFFAQTFDTKLISTLITFAFIIYVLLYMLNQYLVNTYVFYESTATECMTSFSKSQKTLKSLWMGFLLVASVVMCLASFIPTTTLLVGIKNGIFWVVRQILSPLQKTSAEINLRGPDEEIKATLAPVVQAATEQVAKKSEVNLLPFFIMLIILILFVLVAIIRSAISASKSSVTEDGDEKQLLHPFSEKLDIDGKKSKRFGAVFGNTTEQKIRKIFYKTITDNIDERLNVKGSLTPTQLCNITYDSVDRDTLYNMKDIYIKARYSDEPSSHKELSEMKDLAKKCSQNSTIKTPKKEKHNTKYGYGYGEGIGGR